MHTPLSLERRSYPLQSWPMLRKWYQSSRTLPDCHVVLKYARLERTRGNCYTLNRRKRCRNKWRTTKKRQLTVEDADKLSSDLPRRQTSRRRTNLHCRSALANFQEERRIPPGLHYFKSAGCCRTCNYGTYVQLSGTAPLILPHNRCTICEPTTRKSGSAAANKFSFSVQIN